MSDAVLLELSPNAPRGVNIFLVVCVIEIAIISLDNIIFNGLLDV